jgi:hypothetical protein
MEEGNGNYNYIDIDGGALLRMRSCSVTEIWYDLGPVLSREKWFFALVAQLVLCMQALIVRI